MVRRLFALVDCAAFYCSCERVFDPTLRGRPVVVLSNNDGCVIARTAEAKALGVPMGAPYFKVRAQLARDGVRVFSSNYTLYADLSRRVMACLCTFTPDVEPYSIDEAFLTLRTCGGDPAADYARMATLAERIRFRVYRWTGIPVRVAIAETKTLAKAGSAYAKTLARQDEAPCVCFWRHSDREAFLAHLPVGQVWGIGRRWAAKLERHGLRTAADLAAAEDRQIRQLLSVAGLRTAYELRGVSCLPLERAPATRHSLIRSRSFGTAVTDPALLAEAVATHAARAAEKLRREGLTAGVVTAFISTKGIGCGPHRDGWAQRTLPMASHRTPDLIRAAKACLHAAYCATDASGGAFHYRKAGVMALDLRPADAVQGALFDTPRPAQAAQADRVMAALDAINRRFGAHTVGFAAMGRPRMHRTDTAVAAWRMRQDHHSPRYTTHWDDLATARA